MKYYYISDLHFGHEHVISLCNRPYSTTEEMNKSMIRICNETVQKDDVLVILGDVANYNYNAVKDLKSISCKKILIAGNHDRHWLKDRDFRHCFVDIVENEIIHDGEYKIFLSHYPMVFFARPKYQEMQSAFPKVASGNSSFLQLSPAQVSRRRHVVADILWLSVTDM